MLLICIILWSVRLSIFSHVGLSLGYSLWRSDCSNFFYWVFFFLGVLKNILEIHPFCLYVNTFPESVTFLYILFSSVQFSRSVVSDSLRSHGLQHSRPPFPLPTPRVYSNSCPLNPWCHPTTSSSVAPFSSHLQSFPASGSFQMSQFFASGGQNIGVSASALVLPMNIEDWFPLGWTGGVLIKRSSWFYYSPFY